MKWEDGDLDLALRGLRDEELPPATLARVRARVLTQARPRRVQWWRWVWVPALAAALAVVAVVPRQPTRVEPPPLLARAPAAPPLSRPAPPAPRRFQPAPPIAETQFARILTDDPNVVILWALDSEGASQ